MEISLTTAEVRQIMGFLGEIPSKHMGLINYITQILQNAEQRAKKPPVEATAEDKPSE